MSKVEVSINGKEIDLNPFVEELINEYCKRYVVSSERV